MYLGDALRVLLRRWYVLLAGLLLLVGAAGLVVKYVPTQYQASGQLLLVLPAQASGVATPTNPYLNLQEGLSTTASLIASSVMTKDTDRELSKGGFKADYSAGVIPGAGPIILVTTKSSSPDNALATRDEVLDRLDKRLTSLQSEVEVPTTQVITALSFNVDKQAEVLPGNKIRALIAVAAILMIFTLVFAFVLDGWRRKKVAPLGDEDSDPGEDPRRDARDTREDPAAPAPTSGGDEPRRAVLVSASSRQESRGTRASRRAKDHRRSARGNVLAAVNASADATSPGAKEPAGANRPGSADED